MSQETMSQPSVDDPIDFGSRLIIANPRARPKLALADEERAYRNWANGNPDAMIMLIFQGLGGVPLVLLLDFIFAC